MADHASPVSLDSLPNELLGLIAQYLHHSSMNELLLALDSSDAREHGKARPLDAETAVHEDLRIQTNLQRLGFTKRLGGDEAGFRLERALAARNSSQSAHGRDGRADSEHDDDDDAGGPVTAASANCETERRVLPCHACHASHCTLGKASVITPVWHLAQTCRTLREICRPWQWCHLDFTSVTNRDLFDFIRFLAPSVSQYTRSFRIALVGIQLASKGVLASDRLEEFEPVRRMALAVVLFRFFDKLTHLDVDLPLGGGAVANFTDHLPDAPDVRELELFDYVNQIDLMNAKPPGPSAHSHLVPVFARYSHLKRLRLEHFDAFVGMSDEHHHILEMIANLESLTHLELISIRQTCSRHQRAPQDYVWRPKLTHLTLYQFVPLSRAVLEDLLRISQDTLKHLELDLLDDQGSLATPSDMDEGPSFGLRRLEFLALGSAAAGVRFLKRFQASPLLSLEIGKLVMPYSEFEPIIATKYFPKLSKLWILPDTDFTELDLQALIVLCEAMAIDCEIDEGLEDDEEETSAGDDVGSLDDVAPDDDEDEESVAFDEGNDDFDISGSNAIAILLARHRERQFFDRGGLPHVGDYDLDW
ncbi:uncharacterized protein L969DRAFT_48317 [Mixia osmundae IAM 14324]|uniref:Uncharacterized protein n=1 Tax=Mixia osmundae (strain CBS 9802 / IAM 14324 / JCM 22182 / KY 12970) TaxID=764103 RepID=G7E6H2_MIXOS|nr:uncharacterized protein L969DRAFT_48317 [Mixia osmundae IAM 14324]KEI40411.1 hypothetical protein L969DRAFT_48317 [Mixia osmundae IAM 14324]GAA98432.1 hypothetical protein E5Q_05118 [Mixia osmundae IAM 14324]